MERRNFVKDAMLVTGGAAAASLAGCGNEQPVKASNVNTGKKYRWRLVMSVPKTLSIWGPAIIEFAENVKLMSGGQLSIDVYGAKELVPAMGCFDAVKRGQVEMSHSAAYYWSNKIRASVFFTTVPFGMNANGMLAWLKEGDGQKLWDELYQPHGVKAFPCGNTGCQMGGWFKKELKTIEDFKGLKMRIPGLGGEVISKAGGISVLLPAGEIFTSLETGHIDATEWVGPYHDYQMGFHKVAKYYYTGGWHEPGSVLEMLYNKKAWDSLPEHLQAILKSCMEQTNNKMYYQWLAKDAEYYEVLKKAGKTVFLPYPKDIIHQMHKYADEILLSISKTDALAKRIYESHRDFQIQFEKYQDISERAYVQSQKA